MLDLSYLATEILRERGWESRLDLTLREIPHLLEAAIDLDPWYVYMIIHPDLEKITNQLLERNNLTHKFPNPLHSLLYAVCTHEWAHWAKIPFSEEYYEEILSGVSEGLIRAKYSKAEIENSCPDGANVFEDIFANTLEAIDEQSSNFIDGVFLFYLLGRLKGDPSFFDTGKMGELSTILVDLQIKMFQRDTEIRNVFRDNYHAAYDSTLSAVVEKCLNSFLEDQQLAERLMSEPPTGTDWVIIRERLGEREKWHEKALDFAVLVAPYLKQHIRLSPDPFTRKMDRDKKLAKRILRRSIEKGHNTGYANNYDYWDELFRSRATQIVIAYATKKEDSPAHIRYLQKRRLDESEPIRNIKWAATKVLPLPVGDELWLYRKDLPVVSKSDPAVKPAGSVPDISFWIDNSGSITQKDWELLMTAIKSVELWLELTGKGHVISYSALNFADLGHTLFSGWHSWYNKQAVSRTLYARRSGSTCIDADKIREVYLTAPDKFLVILTSDGELNEDVTDTLNELEIQLRTRKSEFAFIKKGARLSFESKPLCELIQKYGGEIHFIENYSDLSKIMLGQAKKQWGNVSMQRAYAEGGD